MSTLLSLILDGELGKLRFDLSRRDVHAMLGAPTRWLDIPGSFTRCPEPDFWKSEGWFYENSVIGLGFDSEDRVKRLGVDLFREEPLPNWFVDWFPTGETTIGMLKAHLRERRIPVWDIIWEDRDHWLLMGKCTCASGAPYRGRAGLIPPDQRQIHVIEAQRDILDLPFLNNPYDRANHKT